MYSSWNIGMSFYNNKRYDIIGRALEKILTDLLGAEDVKVVCREMISENEYMPEKERFQIIIGNTSEDWEKILKENYGIKRKV